MATVLDIARSADVSPETVLRVLNGEPVGSDSAQRVREAVDALGAPAYPSKNRPLPAPVVTENGQDSLLDALHDAKADLNGNSDALGTIIYEAVRVEIRPVADRMAVFFDRLIEEVSSLRDHTAAERQERLEDVALLLELVTAGWRGVDRRLGRVEKMLERLQAEPQNGRRASKPPS